MIKNKNIWIIGASSGIGYELAINLSKENFLILSARDENALQKLQNEIGNKNKIYSLDVANYQEFSKQFQKIKNDFNKIDLVIFMAGIYKPGTLFDLDIDYCQKTILTNLQGSFNLIKIILPFFREQKYGQIALCSSIAGYVGLPNSQPYSSTKAAMINLAQTLYLEEKKNNIDVKLISPSFVKTRLTDQNNFQMPGIIDAKTAAQYIVKGLKSDKFEICFPGKLTLFLKFLRILPNQLYLKYATKSRVGG